MRSELSASGQVHVRGVRVPQAEALSSLRNVLLAYASHNPRVGYCQSMNFVAAVLLLVVDEDYRCIGLITVKDMEKAQAFPHACKDEQGRLRTAAATGVGTDGMARAEALLEAGADVIVVDTAHGHSQGVVAAVGSIKRLSNKAQVIAGNVATAEGARALVDAGVDGLKVGIGPGSICTTRMVAGVGVPQLTALFDTVEVCQKQDVPVIADGGIKFSGDLAKAMAAGASAAMIGVTSTVCATIMAAGV